MAVAGCHGTSVERLKAFLQKNPSQVTTIEYRVMPPDVIQVSSTKILELGGGAAGGAAAGVNQVVRPDGKINLPLVLDVLAQSQPTTLAWPERIHVVRGKPPRKGGYLPDEAKKSLTQADGNSAAEAPGATAGQDKAAPHGADAKALESKVVVVKEAEFKEAIAVAVRDKKDQGPAQAEVMVIDMMVMVHDGDLSHNVILEPDDVVYVPPNPLAAFGLAVQQLLLGIQPTVSTVQLPASAIYTVKSLDTVGSSKQVP
ncbi:MAG: hypothetical protein NT049_17310 [Planctomycetota bacterium]|nr:hypothetical protein [Planctomycetota bacterium]